MSGVDYKIERVDDLCTSQGPAVHNRLSEPWASCSV